jgi:hypothetical protein
LWEGGFQALGKDPSNKPLGLKMPYVAQPHLPLCLKETMIRNIRREEGLNTGMDSFW